MHDHFTPGEWTTVNASQGDGPECWRTAPPRIESPKGPIATLETYWKTPDEIKANARIMAATPKLVRALAVIVLDPRIRVHLSANDPKALQQETAALVAAGVLGN